MNLQILLEGVRPVLTRKQWAAVRDADTELKRLRERVTVLEAACRAVLASWESGDLAAAVRELGEVIDTGITAER